MEQFINNHPIVTFLCFLVACSTLAKIFRRRKTVVRCQQKDDYLD